MIKSKEEFMQNFDSMSVKQRIAAFDNLNGDSVVYNDWILFENGAQREVSPLGPLSFPPEDEYDRAKRITFFWKLKHEKASGEFSNLKKSLLRHAQAGLKDDVCPPPLKPTEEAVKELNALKRKVQLFSEKYRQAVSEQENLLPKWKVEQNDKSNKNRAELESFAAAIQEIKI